MNVAGAVLGYGGDNTIGQHGGSVGNDPNAWVNDYINAPIDYLHGDGTTKSKKKGKKKKKQNKMHIYKRNFVESLMSEEVEDIRDIDLVCTIFTENKDYEQIICDVIKKSNSPFEVSEECIFFKNTDKNIQSVLESMQTVLTEEPFENGDIIALIGELDID